MPYEAKIKLSADTSQAQQQLDAFGKKLQELGSGTRIKIGDDGSPITGGNDSSSSDAKSLITEQSKLIKSLDNYISVNQEFNNKLLNKLDAIEKAVGNGGGNTPNKPPTTPHDNGTTTPSTPSGGNPLGNGTMTKLLTQLAAGATIAAAVNSLLSYVKSGASSSENSELLAYQVYNPTNRYEGSYDTARDNAASVGSPYGYDVYDTLNVQKSIVAGTGDVTDTDTSAILGAARSLVVDENSLASAYGSAYQTGAYETSEASQFAALFAASIEQSGMYGRQDEQLEILEQISDLLDENLTAVTQDQYKTATGLYALFSNSSQAMSGSSAMSLANSLNGALTSDSTSIDVALGKWSGDYSSLWEYQKAKEQGISNPENLSKLLTSFEQYNGVSDLSSDNAKYALQQYFKSLGYDLNTTQIETIAQNEDAIKNGTYTLDESSGEDYLAEESGGYYDSKLSSLLEYEAETQNAQEQIGDDVNEIKQYWANFYNNLPQWLQNVVSGTGAVASTVGGVAVNVGSAALGSYLGSKVLGSGGLSGLFGKLFGSGASTAAEAAGAAAEGVSGAAASAAEGASGVASGLGEAAAGSTDEIIEGVASAAAGSGTSAAEAASGLASGLDEAAEAAGAAAEGVSGVSSALSKVAKAAPWIAVAIEAISTGIEVSGDLKNDDSREAANDVGGGIGSVGGGLGGAAAGAAAGAAIGSVVPGLGTAIGGAIGGIIGGIGGSAAGNAVGEAVGDKVYTSTSGRGYSITDSQYDKLSDYYDEVSELYSSKGNNAAQKYTKSTIVPYLKEIGVSESIYKHYTWDVGKPDFMKDFENGVYDPDTSSSKSHSVDGSWAIGNDYIPYDGYLATLHKGEAVLNAHDASVYRSSSSETSSGTTNVLEIKISGSIDGMTSDNQNLITQQISTQLKKYMSDRTTLRQLSSNSKRVFT